MPGYAMRAGQFLKTTKILGVIQNHLGYKMIDFIAKISFDNTYKDKKLYLYPNLKAKQTSCLIRSYEDDKVQIKYSTQDKDEFIRKTNDKKFVVLAFIHKMDRANLKNYFKNNDIEMKSDPEILLDLYLEHGEEALKKSFLMVLFLF